MSSASDIMAAAIVVAVVLASILIIQGVEFSQAAQAFSSQSLVFNQKHALNDLNAVLSTSVPLTKGTVLQMISTQVYYRNSVFNYENQTVDLKNLTQQAFDYAFGPGNYFAYANPTIGTVHLIFIINGNTYFGGAVGSLTRVLPTILSFFSNYQFDVKFYVLDMDGGSVGMTCNQINQYFNNTIPYFSCTDLQNTTMNYYYNEYAGAKTPYLGYQYQDWLLASTIAASQAVNSSEYGSVLIFPISDSYPGGSQPNACVNNNQYYSNWCNICTLDCSQPMQNSNTELSYLSAGNSSMITDKGVYNLDQVFRLDSSIYLFPIQPASCGISQNYWYPLYFCNQYGGYAGPGTPPFPCANSNGTVLPQCTALTINQSSMTACEDQACDAGVSTFDSAFTNPQTYGLPNSTYIGEPINLVTQSSIADSVLLNALNQSINSVSNYSFSIGTENLSANRISIQRIIPLSNLEQGTLTFWLYSSTNPFTNGTNETTSINFTNSTNNSTNVTTSTTNSTNSTITNNTNSNSTNSTNSTNSSKIIIYGNI